MAENLVVLDGSTFFVSDESGDIDTGPGADRVEGLFHSDVRHLARWSLLVDGQPIEVLSSRNVDYYSARIVGAPAGRGAAVTVRRERVVADGVHEDIWVDNHTANDVDIVLRLEFGTDFADLLAIKFRRATHGTTAVEVADRGVSLHYASGAYRRATRIDFD